MLYRHAMQRRIFRICVQFLQMLFAFYMQYAAGFFSIHIYADLIRIYVTVQFWDICGDTICTKPFSSQRRFVAFVYHIYLSTTHITLKAFNYHLKISI